MPTIREFEPGEAGARQKIRDKCEKIQTKLKIVLSSKNLTLKSSEITAGSVISADAPLLWSAI